MPTAPNLWNKFRSLAHASQKKSARKKHDLQRTLSLEALEQRRVLSVSPTQFYLSGSKLIVNGSDDGDTVTVSEAANGNISVRLEAGGESITREYTSLQLTRIEFNGKNGDDVFTNSSSLPSSAFGEGGNDTLIGSSAVDEFDGGDGIDSLIGGDGNDVLKGGLGNDSLSGDAGADILYGNDGDDVMRGGADNDVLRGGYGNDVMLGEYGDDRIYGDLGNDALSGGDGNDELQGSDGNDNLQGGRGNDTLLGELGNDRLYGDDGNDVLIGNDGDDHMKGGAGADTLRGGAGRDFINGQIGDDKLFGDADADVLVGEDGADEMYGGDGNDSLVGGLGLNSIQGENGDDRIFGGDDAEVLYGGEGNDEIKGGGGNDSIRGGAGNDFLNGQDGDDKLFGEIGSDTLLGEAGEDELSGGDDDDALDGGSGNDFLAGDFGNDQLFGGEGHDTAYGGQGNDRLYGGAGVDTLRGDLGNDQLNGEGDNDWLYGDDGDDVLDGGDGGDTVYGGSDNDLILGGLGDDSLNGDDGADILEGNDGNDFLVGSFGDDMLRGGSGNDALRGREGNDDLWGDEGNDNLQGESGDDFLSGGGGDDFLSGLDGNDVLLGDDGVDTLEAGLGADVLIGGNGVDTLNGSTGEDLLIGGLVSHDPATLKLLLSQWASGATYSERIQGIEDEAFAAFLRSEETVFDDYVTDSVTGGSDLDWIFVPGAMSVYDPTGQYDGTVRVTDQLPVVEGFDLIDSLDNLRDVESGEKVSTLIPHFGDSKSAEHIALFELVRYDQVTHHAVASGNWNDSATWAGGVIPTNGARVLIPIGIQVTVNKWLDTEVATMRVDGTLSFATNVNTRLKADTVIVSNVGRLEIGTAANPIAANVKSELKITDNGAINRDWDPFGISRGLISHGSVSMYGAAKTSSLELVGPAFAGTSLLVLAEVPTGWRVGDMITIAGTSTAGNESEDRTIRAIIGNTVVVDPLQYNHVTSLIGQKVHIANLTRNILIDSEATKNDRRGHVMFMHNQNVHIANVQFDRMGRTDKSDVVNDSVVDDDWNLVPGTGTNQRARYAVHFHRTGTNTSSTPATIEGSVVTDNPGWGYVNHSSYVEMTNNVAYNITGAGFVTEVGDEIGSFRNNIAINIKASGDTLESRLAEQDFGHTGDGFWFQGAGISVVNNVVANAQGHAFIFYTLGLDVDGQPAKFSATNLPDPTIAQGATTILSNDVPVFDFSGNLGYSSGIGLSVWYNLRSASHDTQSVFHDSVFWNNEVGAEARYSHRTVFRDLIILRDFASLGDIAVETNANTKDVTFDNLTVSGYHVGIDAAKRGYSLINGGSFATRIGVIARPAMAPGRVVVVQGNFVMVPLPSEVLGGWTQKEVSHALDDLAINSSINHLFYDSKVFLNYGLYQNQQLYSPAQVATAVPFPIAKPHIPSQYVGLTTQQISTQFGLTIGGEIAPATAQIVPNLGGLLQLIP